MRGLKFHKRVDGKRRGGNLPWRLPISAHRGVTLVELMISMLILAIVCIAWLQIIGIQSARKEARRREAVERLAGMMDAFMCLNKSSVSIGFYKFNKTSNALSFERGDNKSVYQLYDGDISPVGYSLEVIQKKDLQDRALFTGGWVDSQRWLIGRLYNHNGAVGDVGMPFFTLPVCLGR